MSPIHASLSMCVWTSMTVVMRFLRDAVAHEAARSCRENRIATATLSIELLGSTGASNSTSIRPVRRGRRMKNRRDRMRGSKAAGTFIVTLALAGGGALAEGLPVSHDLPAALAVQAATTAVETCTGQGYHVTATVV